MTEQAEREDHVVARWPSVVRVLVLLGAPLDHAHVVGLRAAVRLLEHADDGEPDVVLHEEVWSAWCAARTRWWAGPTGAPTLPDDVEARLDRLAPDVRHHLALRAAAQLTPEQADEVTGVVAHDVPPALVDELARVAETLDVEAPDLTGLRADVGRQDRRRRWTTAVAAVAIVGSLGVVAVVGLGAVEDPPADELAEAAPTRTPAPARIPVRNERRSDDLPVTWYDGSRVHVGGRSVLVPEVEALVPVDSGVVAVRADGRLQVITNDGSALDLGESRPGADVAADGDRVAWIDGQSDDLLLSSVQSRLRRAPAPADARVVAVVGDAVWLDTVDGTSVVRPGGDLRVLLDAEVLAVRPGVEVHRAGRGRLSVRRPGLGPVLLVGTGAQLSPDGSQLLTRQPGTLEPSVVDVDDGSRWRLPLAGQEVLDATLADDGSVVAVVRRSTDVPINDRTQDSNPREGFELVVCRREEAECSLDTRIYDLEAQPVLPH